MRDVPLTEGLGLGLLLTDLLLEGNGKIRLRNADEMIGRGESRRADFIGPVLEALEKNDDALTIYLSASDSDRRAAT